MESHARHFDLEVEKERIFLFLQKAQEYAVMRDELREALMNMPIEVFGEVTKSKADYLTARVERDKSDPINLLREVVQKVVRIRHICIWCFKGYEKEVGGRNGGEERAECSNPECISQKFMR